MAENDLAQGKPLEEQEIVVHVPQGMAQHVRVEETTPESLQSEIVVQVSRKRKPGVVPVLGVIVK